jgi:hypothetical protein
VREEGFFMSFSKCPCPCEVVTMSKELMNKTDIDRVITRMAHEIMRKIKDG